VASGFYPSSARLPDGYVMHRVLLDERGRDASGWVFGLGLPLWCVTDGAESLTIRASSPVAALAMIMLDGWPPKHMRRYNWEYAEP
jgi:hypothetical protein